MSKRKYLKEIEDNISITEDRNNCEIKYSEMDGSEELGVTISQGQDPLGKSHYAVRINANLDSTKKVSILKHEVGHINQDSFDPRYIKTIKQVADEYISSYSKKHNLTTPLDPVQTNARIPQEILSSIYSAHFALFNSMEDIRMESRESFNRLGRAYEFLRQRKEMKGTIKDVKSNPINSLLAARFFDGGRLEDLADPMQKIHDSLELQSHKGLLKVYREFCKKYLHPYLDQSTDKSAEDIKEAAQIADQKDVVEQQLDDLDTQISREENQHYSDWSKDQESTDKHFATINRMVKERTKMRGKRTRLKHKSEAKMRDARFRPIESTSGSLVEKRVHETTSIQHELDEQHKEGNKIEAYSESEIEQVDLDREKSEEIKKLISHMPTLQDKSDLFKDLTNSYKSSNGFIPLSSRIQAEIKRTIDTVTTKKYGLHSRGVNVNLKAYLNSITSKNTKIFNRRNRKIKLSILLSIDASGSMDGDRIRTCLKIAHGVMKAVRHNKFIEMKAMTWGGQSDGTVGYSLIDDLDDIGKLGINGHYSGTPTPRALLKTKQIIRNMKGEKKVVIFLTDGEPNNLLIQGMQRKRDEVLEICNKEIKEIRKYSRFIPLYVDANKDDRQLFKMLRAIDVDSTDIDKILLRQFRKVFVEVLK